MPRQAKEDILRAIRLGRNYNGPLVSYPVSIADIAPADAVKYSWLVVAPAKTEVLQIDRIVLNALNAGAYSATFLNKTAINALAMVFSAPTGGGLFVRSDAPQSLTFARSGILPATGNAAILPSGVGSIPWRDSTAAGAASLVIQPPDPFVLWGDDTSSPGFGVAGPTTNTIVIATFHGRVWPLDTDTY